MALVLDTGVLFGALHEKDRDHESCATLLRTTTEALVVPSLVLVELDYWLRKVGADAAWLSFCQDVEAGGYTLTQLDPAALLEAARLQRKYHDLPLGLVDAAVFLTCQELDEDKVATLDARHFSVLRTARGRALQIVPG